MNSSKKYSYNVWIFISLIQYQSKCLKVDIIQIKIYFVNNKLKYAKKNIKHEKKKKSLKCTQTQSRIEKFLTFASYFNIYYKKN